MSIIKEIIFEITKEFDGDFFEISIDFPDKKNRDRALHQILDNINLKSKQTIWDKNSQKTIIFGDKLSKKIFSESDSDHIICNKMFKIEEDIGITVFENNISLDFKTGLHWTKNKKDSLENFLNDMEKNYHASISIE